MANSINKHLTLRPKEPLPSCHTNYLLTLNKYYQIFQTNLSQKYIFNLTPFCLYRNLPTQRMLLD